MQEFLTLLRENTFVMSGTPMKKKRMTLDFDMKLPLLQPILLK